VEIKEIGIQEIPEASIDITVVRTSFPEIPKNIGFPVIQMPGCVRARTLKNKQLVKNDKKGNLILCDGNVPTLESMAVDWDALSKSGLAKEETKIVPPLPKLKGDKGKKVKEKDGKDNQQGQGNIGRQDFNIPNIDGQFIADVLPCPPLDTLAKTPIGSLGKGGLARIKGWKRDELTGKCETVWEGLNPIDIAGNYAPEPTVLINTSTIAITSVVGVTVIGQPIAKFFQSQLKGQVKSISKKITKKLLAIRGKKPKILSLAERRKEQRASRK
tara:strand:- start:1775 stop:2590 length:816 start_codon:yes stop_codon:yes gene_type:complete